MSQDRPIIIFLDSYEYATDVLIAWLEHRCMLPLVLRAKSAIFLGSQLLLRWRQFDVRTKVKPMKLEVLSEQATAAQLGHEELGKFVYTHTRGHPLSNELSYELISEFLQGIKKQYQDLDQKDIIQQVKHLFQKEALYIRIHNSIKDRVNIPITQPVEDIITVMSMFREFDVSTLQAIMPIYKDLYQIHSQSYLLYLLKQTLETRLVSWDNQIRAYHVEPAIQPIFMQMLNTISPDVYQQIRLKALHHYTKVIEHIPSNRSLYIKEYCYHYLMQSLNDQGDHFIRDLIRDILKFLHEFYIDNIRIGCDIAGLQEVQLQLSTDRYPLETHTHRRALNLVIAAVNQLISDQINSQNEPSIHPPNSPQPSSI